MEPGTIYPLELRSFPTSNRFLLGHRIRVDIASSNFPHFDVNPNVDCRIDGVRPQVARNTVYVGGDTPSHVVLPIVPG